MQYQLEQQGLPPAGEVSTTSRVTLPLRDGVRPQVDRDLFQALGGALRRLIRRRYCGDDVVQVPHRLNQPGETGPSVWSERVPVAPRVGVDAVRKLFQCTSLQWTDRFAPTAGRQRRCRPGPSGYSPFEVDSAAAVSTGADWYST